MKGVSSTFIIVSNVLLIMALTSVSQAESVSKGSSRKPVFDHWTIERINEATPRDFVIDHRGLGYLKGKSGKLKPLGHQVEAENGRTTTPANKLLAKPSSPDVDILPPTISNMDPAQGTAFETDYTFSAVVTDVSGLKSVVFVVEYPDGVTTQSLNPSRSGDVWEVSLQGFSDGDWRWWVVAKDKGTKGGNTATSEVVDFTVGVSENDPGDGLGSDTITNGSWSFGGAVQTAVGRIYFEMPNNPKWKRWAGYVCSGTVVVDGVTGRSIILTAAHCVYDDVNHAFARNVIFIPNQAGTTGSGTDLGCSNDPMGCWAVSYGVVDINWTRRTFPDNAAWDYAFYVVDDGDASAYQGNGILGDILDVAATPLAVQFTSPFFDDGDVGKFSLDFTHALGYSYSDDPNFMYCADDMAVESSTNWWLPNCGLSGGASGGPWVQPMSEETGDGSIVSVNSWGYTTSPGMAGPRLDNTSVSCVFSYAMLEAGPESLAPGNAGVALMCP